MGDIQISTEVLLALVIPFAFSAGVFLVRNEQQHKEARKDINALCVETTKLQKWIKKLLNHQGCPFEEDDPNGTN